MRYSVLSIPGLPNGLMSLSSKNYHNPYPFLEELRAFFGAEYAFDSFIWPKVHPFPLGNWLRFLPFIGLFVFYFYYQLSASYRKQLSLVVQAKLQALFQDVDCVYVIAHSHGNRIFIDSLQDFILPKGKKMICLGQAPAFSGVCFGLKSDDVTSDELQSALDKCSQVEFFRVSTDLLSGDVVCDSASFHSYVARWWEVLFLGHDTVRGRSDVLVSLKSILKSNS